MARRGRWGGRRPGRSTSWLRWVVAGVRLLMLLAVLLNGGQRPSTRPRQQRRDTAAPVGLLGWAGPSQRAAGGAPGGGMCGGRRLASDRGAGLALVGRLASDGGAWDGRPSGPSASGPRWGRRGGPGNGGSRRWPR